MCYFLRSAPPQPTPLVLAVAHLCCAVFVVSFTSSAAPPLMSAQLMNLMKYVTLLGVSLEANGTLRGRKNKKIKNHHLLLVVPKS